VITAEQMRHRLFRLENPDDAGGYASGYVAREMETTGSPTDFSYPECA
jgi:hypothetical protein